MPRVEVLRSTTTAQPLIMVDQGEENPPVYTVEQAWKLHGELAADPITIEARDSTGRCVCVFCMLDDTLQLLR